MTSVAVTATGPAHCPAVVICQLCWAVARSYAASVVGPRAVVPVVYSSPPAIAGEPWPGIVNSSPTDAPLAGVIVVSSGDQPVWPASRPVWAQSATVAASVVTVTLAAVAWLGTSS